MIDESIFKKYLFGKDAILVSNENDLPVKAKIIGYSFVGKTPILRYQTTNGSFVFSGAVFLFNQKFFDFLNGLSPEERRILVYNQFAWRGDLNYFVNSLKEK